MRDPKIKKILSSGNNIMNPINNNEDDLFELREGNPNRSEIRAIKPSKGAYKEDIEDWKEEKKSMKREKDERRSRRTEKRGY